MGDCEASARDGFVCLQTGQPRPRHFCRQAQWKRCWQRIVRRPVVSSMRSRQTGQVGSSTRECVGGGKGFGYGWGVGVKGSWESSGKEVHGLEGEGVWTVMDLTKRMWQVSGCLYTLVFQQLR